jgi:hypothetical protein
MSVFEDAMQRRQEMYDKTLRLPFEKSSTTARKSSSVYDIEAIIVISFIMKYCGGTLNYTPPRLTNVEN